MFDVGLSELLVIGLVALIVIGPKRLPEVARAAGRWAGRLRRFVSDVKQDLDRELHQAELSELRQLKQEFGKTIVMVTHDPRALRFVDDAFHLDKGVLLEGEAAARADEAIRLAAGGGLTSDHAGGAA